MFLVATTSNAETASLMVDANLLHNLRPMSPVVAGLKIDKNLIFRDEKNKNFSR